MQNAFPAITAMTAEMAKFGNPFAGNLQHDLAAMPNSTTHRRSLSYALLSPHHGDSGEGVRPQNQYIAA
jgi:hypothetical protein